MVGSSGERMLSITLPHVEMWNMWYDDYENSPEGLAPALATLDAACEKAGRDPKTLVRTICPYVKLPGGKGRSAGDPLKSRVRPIPVDRLAEELRTYAGMGIGHVMLVMDPITEASIEALAPVLAELDG
jgi:alkanesulfonate monooxygenase SsuD/methylene tetrahydromethanopterin reductase-like flavin-dependent oxidoreductase (luciferase family)